MTPFPGTPIHDMALRGEGGYRLLSGGWEDFDKYPSGVLELETVSLGRLKRYQIECYVNMYLRNRRFQELGRLAVANRAVGWEMLTSAIGRTALRLADACDRVRHASPRPLRLLPDRRYARAEVVEQRGHGRPRHNHVVARDPRSQRSKEKCDLRRESAPVDRAASDEPRRCGEQDEV